LCDLLLVPHYVLLLNWQCGIFMGFGQCLFAPYSSCHVVRK